MIVVFEHCCLLCVLRLSFSDLLNMQHSLRFSQFGCSRSVSAVWCYSMSVGEQFPTFQRSTLSELQDEAVEGEGMLFVEPSGTAEQVTQHHIPENSCLCCKELTLKKGKMCAMCIWCVVGFVTWRF